MIFLLITNPMNKEFYSFLSLRKIRLDTEDENTEVGFPTLNDYPWGY